MSNHDNYHLNLPSKLAGTTVAGAIQSAADAYNTIVDDKGPCCQEAIDASKAYCVELDKGLAEVGIDISKALTPNAPRTP